MDQDTLEQEIQLLHERVCYALGDPTRILMLYLLNDGEKCVNDLIRITGLPQSTVSRQLRVLRERGLVKTRRQGPSILYSLMDVRIIQALDILRQVLVRQLENHADLAALLRDQDN